MTLVSTLIASLSGAWGVACLVATLGYAVASVPRQAPWARWIARLAWAAQAVALAYDILDLQSPEPGARFGFAPALSFTIWMVIGVFLVERRGLIEAQLRRRLSAIAFLMVLLAWIFPGERHAHLSSPYEPVHWVLGLASYGLFGVAVVHAMLWSRADKQLRGKTPVAAQPGEAQPMPLLRIENLTFRFVAVGFVVLTLTLILGSLFASPWRWDHKTVFSLLAWFVFLGLLLGRRYFGWRGKVAARWLYTGSALLLLAYVGSRFVFEVVLHRLPTTPF